MAINITNLIAAIDAKLSGDSDGTFVLSNASKLADDIKNTRKHLSIDNLPAADSSNAGDIVRVGITDDSAAYYVSNGYSWKAFSGGGGTPVGLGVYEGPRTLSKSVDSADEGDTVSFKLVTSGATDGTVIAYRVTGITDSDISSGSLTGNFVLNNDSAVVSFTLANDSATDGTETLTLSLLDVHLDSSQSIVINDTSKGAIFGYVGTDYGFYAGGAYVPPTVYTTSGSYFPFASDTPAPPDSFLTLTAAIYRFSTASSPTHGYSYGGNDGTPAPSMYNRWQTFPFSSGGNASLIPSLVNGTMDGTSATDTDNGVGYSVNGRDADDTPLAPVSYFIAPRRHAIFFSSGTTATYTGYLRTAYGAGCSAPDVSKGFVVAGQKMPSPTIQYGILSFGFANGSWATHTPWAVPPAVSSPPDYRYNLNPHAQNSGTHGYLAGGFPSLSSIVKFPFSGPTVTIASVGNLTSGTHSANGLSGANNGYMLGIPIGFPTYSRTGKDKFPFASDTNASDVGDMNNPRRQFGTYQQ